MQGVASRSMCVATALARKSLKSGAQEQCIDAVAKNMQTWRRAGTGPASERDSARDAQRRRLRGLPARRHGLGASAHVSDLRSRRLLRFLCESPRAQTLPLQRAPDRSVVRARGELALVLRARGAGLKEERSAHVIISQSSQLRLAHGRRRQLTSPEYSHCKNGEYQQDDECVGQQAVALRDQIDQSNGCSCVHRNDHHGDGECRT